MAKQLAIDKLKMEEQRKIQMQMWKDTNYAAQVEELKKAGLSIGLMYGKGGAGGTTTGAGATGVSAPTAPSGMGMINGSQLATQLANIELIKAQTNKTNIEAEKDYRDWETDRKSTRLNSSHRSLSRMPSSA